MKYIMYIFWFLTIIIGDYIEDIVSNDMKYIAGFIIGFIAVMFGFFGLIL